MESGYRIKRHTGHGIRTPDQFETTRIDSMRTQLDRTYTFVFVAVAVFSIFSPFWVAGCHRTAPLTPQEAEGKHLYSVRCAHCHEDNDLQLKKVPPDLHGIFSRTALPSGSPPTDQEVRRVVLSGKGLMPAFAGRFTDEQMADLLAYLHTNMR
jgi:mono/diheme cytochrome c family protein